MGLGLSTRNRKLTHLPKLPGPTRKSVDPTPMMVGGGSSPRKINFDELDGGFSFPKLDEPDPTDESRERRLDLPRSTQIRWRFGSFWLDLAMRLKFSLKSRLEVVFFASIPWLSHKSKEKSADSAKIQWRTAKIRRWDGSFHSNLGLRWSFLLRSRGCCTDPKKNQQIRQRSSEDTVKIRRWDGSSCSNLGLRWSFLLRSRGCHIDPKKNQQIQRRSSEDTMMIRWWDGSSHSNLGLRWSFLLRSHGCCIDPKKNQ